MTFRNFNLRNFATLAVLVATAGSALAQTPLGTAFSYQGKLNNSGLPYDGNADFVFRLYNASAGGSLLGTQTLNSIPVSDGLFTVQLDFGATAFSASEARWLSITVNGVLLNPRQPIQPAPFALGIRLPLAQTVTTASDAINITNAGTGDCAQFNITNAANSSKALEGRTNGSGIAVQGVNTGTGRAGFFQVSNSANALTALYGTTNSTNTDVAAVAGVNTGMGRGGIFQISNTANNAAALYATTNGASGFGVQGEGHWGVYGHTSDADGYGGVFAGSGFLGSGQSLLVWGDSVFGGKMDIGGNVGIGLSDDAQAKLHVYSTSDSEPGSGGIMVLGLTTGANLSFDNNEIMARNNGLPSTLYLNNDGGDVIIAPGATTRVSVLEITGADVAEKFPVSEETKPGLVVAIDPANPGKLCLARGTYNKCVAGVISGAGDLQAGTILGNMPGSEQSPPVALSGRVWVHCDASGDAIEPGDLLTTSDTPGHAMKAADASRAHGTSIGKAMTALKKGERGLVLVLVNLQ